VRRGIHLSINGIAAGLRNSGWSASFEWFEYEFVQLDLGQVNQITNASYQTW